MNKQQFLMFMTCKSMEGGGRAPTMAQLNDWGVLYEERLSTDCIKTDCTQKGYIKRGWKYYASGFMRFLFAGFITSIPAILIMLMYATYSEQSPGYMMAITVLILQVSYSFSGVGIVCDFIFSKALRKPYEKQ